MVATGAQGAAVQLYTAKTGEVVKEFGQGYLSGVDFSPDGAHLAAGYHMAVKVWDNRTGIRHTRHVVPCSAGMMERVRCRHVASRCAP